MHDVILFAFLGLAAGAVYSLLALGIVVIYKGSGVLNFGHGAVALVGAVVESDLIQRGLSPEQAVAPTLVACLIAGALIYLLVMRPLRTAPALARDASTLALLITIPVAVTLTHQGLTARPVPSVVPSDSVTLFGVTFGADRLWMLGVALVATVLLSALFRFTRFGLSTRAVAESEFAASLLGFSPDVIGLVNWMLGCLLAGAAGLLIAPVAGIDPSVLPFLVIPALAAALLGNFTSFWLTGSAAFVIGILQSEALRFWDQPGGQDLIVFAVIIGVMALRSRALPGRDYLLRGRPPISLAGRIRPFWVVGSVLVVLLLANFLSGEYAYALQTSLILAIVLLSQTIVTGFVGQISLAQMTFAGIGGLLTARFATDLGIPFPFPILVAAVIAAPVGAALGLPAVRVRGINLAVVTLSLSVAVNSFVFGNANWTEGVAQSSVPTPSIFGWSLSATVHPGRYAVVTVIALILIASAASLIRRSALGRRMLAVRENERAAAATGINVPATKLQAFALSTSVAAVGGGLLAYQASPFMPYSFFGPQQSATLLAISYIGGVACVSGAPIAALMIANGGLLAVLLAGGFGSVDNYFTMASGIFLILTIILNPSGIAPIAREQVLGVRGKLFRSSVGRLPSDLEPTSEGETLMRRVDVPATNVDTANTHALKREDSVR